MSISLPIKPIRSSFSYCMMENSCYFLKCTKMMLVLVGLWPFKLSNRFLQMIYTVYSIIIQTNFTIFVVTLTIGWKYVIHSSDQQRANFLQYVITYVFAVWKMFLVRSSSIKKLVEEIIMLESTHMSSNKDIKKIHCDISRYNFKIFGSLLFVTSMAVIQFIILSYGNLLMWKRAESQGIETKKTLIIPEWFPFNTEKVFDVIYFFQIWNGSLAGGLIVGTDTIFISLVLFTSIRLKILGYKMKNFGREKGFDNMNNSRILKNLILEHKDIIRYVTDLNAALKLYFLIDFLAKSYHISMVLFNVLVVFKTSKLELASYLCNTSMLFVEVANMYIQANNVSLESEKFSTYIYKSNWHEQSPEIKKVLHIMMLRTQRPLKLESGGIIVLGNELLLKILKAAYTYILFSKKNNF